MDWYEKYIKTFNTKADQACLRISFKSFKELMEYIQNRLKVDRNTSFEIAWHLVDRHRVNWDTGWNCYVWPRDLTEEELYERFELAEEQANERAATMPF